MVEKVQQLGDIVSFSKGKVSVLSDLFNLIPSEFQDDFCTVLESACSAYYAQHEKNKADGVKIAPAQVKKQKVEEIINPFLDRFGLANYKHTVAKTYRPTNPGIPRDEKPRVERVSIMADIEKPDDNEVSSLFDNYDWSEIPDETPKEEVDTTSSPFDDLFIDEFNDSVEPTNPLGSLDTFSDTDFDFGDLF